MKNVLVNTKQATTTHTLLVIYYAFNMQNLANGAFISQPQNRLCSNLNRDSSHS